MHHIAALQQDLFYGRVRQSQSVSRARSCRNAARHTAGFGWKDMAYACPSSVDATGAFRKRRQVEQRDRLGGALKLRELSW
jgi:hypothetical protein